jgi:ligand-binding sensor domain-containing protein/signal transduction histidine kinase/DNA-binding response OmpR family regulator
MTGFSVVSALFSYRRSIYIRSALILTSIFFISDLQAENANVRFQNITSDDGLSQNNVYCLLQDRHGFIWMGTQDGLNRYDGYSFLTFRNDPDEYTSLSHNHISTISEDPDGTLWIGTLGGGLNHFDPATGQFTRYRFDARERRDAGINRITCLTQDPDEEDILWIGTQGRGMLRFDKSSGSSHPAPESGTGLSNREITAIYAEPHGPIWVATTDGLVRLSKENNGQVRFFPNVDSSDPHPGNGNYTALLRDRTGVFWLGSRYDGITHFRGDDARPVSDPALKTVREALAGTPVFNLLEDREGNIWIATYRGLTIFQPNSGKTVHYRGNSSDPAGLSSEFINAVIEDRSGDFWIASNSGGVFRMNNKGEDFKLFCNDPTAPRTLADNSVLSLYFDTSGSLWVGTFDGLSRLVNDKNSPHFINYTHANGEGLHNIYSICQDHSGNLWLGSLRAIFRFDPRTETFTKFDHQPERPGSIPDGLITQIMVDADNQLWIGSWGFGIARVPLTTVSSATDPATVQFRHYRHIPGNDRSLSIDKIQRIFQDAAGTIWIGTAEGGLNRYHPESDDFTVYITDPDDPASLSQNYARILFEDSRNQFWIGTFGAGLNRMDRERGTFSHILVKDGLPNGVIQGIQEDDHHNLWISSNSGITRYSLDSGTFRNYDAADGLQGNEFNNASARDLVSGLMAFGGNSGLNVFHPDSIHDDTYPPPVVISRLDRFHAESGGLPESDYFITGKDKIDIGYDENMITLEFAALSYHNNFKNQYAYRLSGYNEHWIRLGTNRRITFTNLPPGDYTLEVKASNEDGIWNENGVRIPLHIAAPPWRTFEAFLLYSLLLILLLYLIRRYELGRINLKNQLEREKFESDKFKELDKIKSRFFANLSHEFRTPLTLILGQIESVPAEFIRTGDYRKLEVARRNARRLLRLINQLLDLSRLESGALTLDARCHNLAGFVRNLASSFESYARDQGITLTTECEYNNIPVIFEPDKLEKVFYNLIANAIKFTPSGGWINIEIKVHAGQNSRAVETIIRDSGIGIPEEQLPYIFDRFYQADNSGHAHYEGTGIGLALARELIELHNGQIRVQNAGGGGTEFCVTLPLAKSETTTPEVMHDQEHGHPYDRISPKEESTPVISTHPLILIVDDNRDIREYLEEQLISEYRVISAGDGKSGFEAARAQIPDLVITDIMMPRIDGFEFCRMLRKEPLTSHIPLIMLTAKAELEDKITGIETGADAYLAKPFHARELLVRVRQLILSRINLRKKFRTATVIRPSEVSESTVDREFMEKICAVIEERIGDEQFGVEQLAESAGLSVSQLNRKLSALIDQPAGQLIRSMRLQRAADLLSRDHTPVAEIAFAIGFSDQANFTRAFKRQFNCNPKEFRERRATAQDN